MTKVAEQGRLVAVLGPTNTGKTHFAIERMLGHSSGIIGLPLRLLAREVYDRVVEQRGPACVALVTGEEKIIPKNPSYWVCTVESTPLDREVAFVAVDEIQLCADEERGHTFTDRLLRARGREETMFMGAQTIARLLRRLLPDIEITTRTRFSKLTYAGAKKLSRLPRRSAIVAFTANDVYAIAEMIRRRKGGAAIVMGALSPRTRNAQVAMYQAGEVDYIVATDAIGMGLNMAVNHVAFASLTKFDGLRHRQLYTQEIAQIAGRAGRHMNDGTFGLISDGQHKSGRDFSGNGIGLDAETIDAIEHHRFAPIERLQWRNPAPDYGSLGALIASLEALPERDGLVRVREAEDLTVLKTLARDEEIRAIAQAPAAIARLWDVCQVPDFRKTMADEHAQLVKRLYTHLMEDGERLPDDWVRGQVARLDRIDGDFDTLATRIAHIRTWTYIANRPDWLADPTHWRGETRKIEDRLSDALHEQLTQRFVDKRSAVLMKRLQADQDIFAAVDASSDVMVEGHYVGRLNGLTFAVDEAARGAEGAVLLNAAAKALRREVADRIRRIQTAPDEAFTLVPEIGEILFEDAPIARLTAGPDPLSPALTVLASDVVEANERLIVSARLTGWLENQLAARLGPLAALSKTLKETNRTGDDRLTGLARGVAFRLLEGLGTLPRAVLAEDLRKLNQDDRAQLRRLGVRFAEASVYMPAILKPEMAQHRLMCWAVFNGFPAMPSAPTPGLTSVPCLETPDGFYEACGFRVIGQRAIRIDMLEKVADMARKKLEAGSLTADSDMMSFVGCSGDDFIAILHALGYVPREQDDNAEAPLEITYVRAPRNQKPGTPRRTGKGKRQAGADRKKARKEAARMAASPFAELAVLKGSLAPKSKPHKNTPTPTR